MYYGFLQFDTIPEIGFAHHFESTEYQVDYTGHQRNFEVVCNVTGEIQMELYGRNYPIREGSIFVLFRELPIRLKAMNPEHNEHYTVQFGMEYELSLQRDAEPPPDKEGILLPLVIPPGKLAEEIRKELISIILELERESGRSSFGASLRILGILQKMDAYARQQRKKMKFSPAQEKISRQVRSFVEKHLEERLTLSDVAEKIGKTPNYINGVFRQVNGMTVMHYINREKMLWVAEKIKKEGMNFETACEGVFIHDVSYGYRLFKRYMGVTPGNYRKGKIFHRKRPTEMRKTEGNR